MSNNKIIPVLLFCLFCLPSYAQDTIRYGGGAYAAVVMTHYGSATKKLVVKR